MLPEKFESPPYTAVILLTPTGSWDVLKLTLPPLSALVARTVAPFKKVTLPVGVPPDDDETVAVKVTALPDTEGFREEISPVVVVAYIILDTKAS